MEKSRHRGNPVYISNALNGGEYRVPGTNYRCDGFPKTPDGMGTIYEFYGKKLTLSQMSVNVILPPN